MESIRLTGMYHRLVIGSERLRFRSCMGVLIAKRHYCEPSSHFSSCSHVYLQHLEQDNKYILFLCHRQFSLYQPPWNNAECLSRCPVQTMQSVIQFIIVSPKIGHDISLNADPTNPMLCLLNSTIQVLRIPYARLYILRILLRYRRWRVLPILVPPPISLLRAPLRIGMPSGLGWWTAHPALLHWRRAVSNSLGFSAAPDTADKN